MNFPIFAILTTLGAGMWCLVLLLVGYYFGEGMVDIFAKYTKEVGIVVVIGIIAYLVYFLRKKNKK
jgi:membrane protein DedA with SNARE-associated domain